MTKIGDQIRFGKEHFLFIGVDNLINGECSFLTNLTFDWQIDEFIPQQDNEKSKVD